MTGAGGIGKQKAPVKEKCTSSLNVTLANYRGAGCLLRCVAVDLIYIVYQTVKKLHFCLIACVGATMPCIVRDMDDDTAIILMVDSNCQREHILPSEKAKAYEMKLEAIKRQGQRTDLTSGQLGQKLSRPISVEQVADDAGTSIKQVQRFIRLNKLTPELMKMVDDGKLKTTPAVELSYLTPEEQEDFLSYMESEGCTPSLSQAQKLKEASKESVLTSEKIQHIMAAKPPSVKPRDPQLMIPVAKVERYFPKGFTSDQMQQVIVKLLENYARAHQHGSR